MEKSILELFKSYISETSDIKDIDEHALKKGLIIPKTASLKVKEEAISLYGKDGFYLNQTFHKSFKTVKELDEETLYVQQILHYFTTYGFEKLGVYDSNTVYIPVEELDIPELDIKEIELILIKPITEAELKEKLKKLLFSGIALSKNTIENILSVSDYIDKGIFDKIKNREVRISLYDKYNIVPDDAESFLRYLIFKTTKQTLKIKSKEMFTLLKNADRKEVLELLKTYLKQNPENINKLASIFFRNKPIFLSLKSGMHVSNSFINTVKHPEEKEINKIVNKLRKLASKCHKPLVPDVLDRLTSEEIVKNFSNMDYRKDIINKIEDITIYREIRILNGILYRLSKNENIVYNIRNGKAYTSKVKEKSLEYYYNLLTFKEELYKHLVNRISEKVIGKTIYIPENITYVAPTSEKQFCGDIPIGSWIDLERDSNLIYGIHWENLENERVDLDLKQMNSNEVFGWDARIKGDNILFTGDVTDAPSPKGATELFLVNSSAEDNSYMVTVNNFTYNKEKVPFKFIIADTKENMIKHNYTINPNDIIAVFNMSIENPINQISLGTIKIQGQKIQFCFNNFGSGKYGHYRGSTSKNDDITMNAFEYYKKYNETQIKLRDLLLDAKAILTDSKTKKTMVLNKQENDTYSLDEEEVPVQIDLSLEAISKETIISIFE